MAMTARELEFIDLDLTRVITEYGHAPKTEELLTLHKAQGIILSLEVAQQLIDRAK